MTTREPPAPAAFGPPVAAEHDLASLVPFGLDAARPFSLRDAAASLWANRADLGYAWNLLRRGVCDGCGHPFVAEAKPAWEILGLVAAAAWPERRDEALFADVRAIREELGRTVPAYAGIERLAEEGDWLQWGGPRLCPDGACPGLPDGRARFGATSRARS